VYTTYLIFAGILDILCYTRLFLKVNVTPGCQNAIFFISHSTKRRVLLDGVTEFLEDVQQPENSSRLELGSKADRMLRDDTLYRIMWHDVSINLH
jgi:hypothetical protein